MMRAYKKENIIHKTVTLSSLKDTSPWGKRLTKCGKHADNEFARNMWLNVNCEECLKIRREKCKK